VLQQHGSVSGAADAGTMAESGWRQARAAAHAERLGSGCGSRPGRGSGKLPERRRIDHGARGATSLHGPRQVDAVTQVAVASRMLKCDLVGSTRANLKPARSSKLSYSATVRS